MWKFHKALICICFSSYLICVWVLFFVPQMMCVGFKSTYFVNYFLVSISLPFLRYGKALESDITYISHIDHMYVISITKIKSYHRDLIYVSQFSYFKWIYLMYIDYFWQTYWPFLYSVRTLVIFKVKIC